MNYKHKIAFLAKKPSRPIGSNWVSLCANGKWTPEALELFDINDPNVFKNVGGDKLLRVDKVAEKLYKYSVPKQIEEDVPEEDLSDHYNLMPYRERLMFFNPNTKVMLFLPDKEIFTDEDIEEIKEKHS